MQELMVDLITSLDGCASAEGWPGWWGQEGPEYLGWLGEHAGEDVTLLLGANTYRLMSGFARLSEGPDTEGLRAEEADSVDELARRPKVVFSATLEPPLAWPNTTLVREDAVEAVTTMKSGGTSPLRTLGSLSLCRSLLTAGLVDRFRVVVFPVVTGRTGRERVYDGWPDVALDLMESRTFDGRIQLLEYVPTVLSGPPPVASA